jgi:hypothetical protein
MCEEYDLKMYHLLVPSLSIYGKLCNSSDRTSLFIMTVLRLSIYWFIYKQFINELITNNKLNNYGYFILIMIILNIISVSIVLSKTYINNPNNIKQTKQNNIKQEESKY